MTIIPPLQVYAVRPDVQVGPLALGIDAVAQRWLGGNAALLLLIGALAGVTVWGLGQLVANGSNYAVIGLTVATAWASLGGWGHVEDALALTAIVCAALAVQTRRGWLAGLLLGIAVACKPWALAAVPIVLGLPRREALRATTVAIIAAVMPWVPFVIAAPRTIDVGRYSWPIDQGSGLHALGFSGVTGSWLRPVQIGVGFLLAALVARRWWQAAPLAAFATKVILDPSVWTYYGLAPVVAASLVDVTQGRRLPWWTFSAVVVMYIAPAVLPATASGIARVAWGVGALTVLIGASVVGSWTWFGLARRVST